MIHITKVVTRKHKKKFIYFPQKIYHNHLNYVPQLKMDDYELMNVKKHPFHQHSNVEHFLAFQDGDVGWAYSCNKK